jgi:anti-sigma factor RsiW
MTCWQARRALVAYHDGELEPGKAERLEAHIMTCPHCQRESAQLRQMRLLLRSLVGPLEAVPYGPQAFQQLCERIQQLPSYAPYSTCSRFGELVDSFPRAWLPATLAGAALINGLVGLGLEEEAFTFFSSYIFPFILD